MTIPGSVAIIPARGGSRRIPRKNVVDFMGKPLIAWSIEAARASGRFETVLVSTDDAEIAEIARAHGAEVPFLRRVTGDDHSPVSLATVEALEQYAAWRGRPADLVMQLLPTCPLRSEQHVRDSLDAFLRGAADFLLSCTDYGPLNPWWAISIATDGTPRPLHPRAMTMRSQDLETVYCPSGAIWIARVPALLASRTFYGPGHRFWPMDWRAAVDIDTPEDLALARALAVGGM
ncbi:cytidylyltransferase domain-containing protein [Dongia sp.]|uniref:acylneuraminate cytidylyltransferase family protein n=1 Tax=Dongia sp. TaxID=1977262 RepID=UPI0035ADD976